MRFRSSLAYVLLGCLLAVACGDETLPHGLSVDDTQPVGPATLPHIESQPLTYVPRAIVTAHPEHALSMQRAANGIELVTGTRTIVQKTLLISNTHDVTLEPSWAAAENALDRIGVPYESVAMSTSSLPALTDGVSTCYFNSIIIANSGVPLTASDAQNIADFEAACSARELVWYAWPTADLGLAFTGTTIPSDGTVTLAHVATPTFFTSVRATAQIPLQYAWGYASYIGAGDTTTIPLLADAAGNVLAAEHTRPDGRQVVSLTFDSSPYLVHSVLLEYDLIRWVTGGVFLGKKRAYLTAQIDDVFIDDDLWDAASSADVDAQYRITGSDIAALAAWQSSFRNSLPAGSVFSAVFAFNGWGTLKSSYTDRTLLAQALDYNKSFMWISHTWDHTNMDGMTQTDAYNEAYKNIKLANNDRLNTFSSLDMVTPDVSGLTTTSALEGIYSAGVRNVVSNTSIPSGQNPSFNVGMANALEPRIYEVPRHPTNIYYDVATPADETAEYDFRYPQFASFDYEQVLDQDSSIGAFYLLQGDIDPLMFHQPNLANYNAGTNLPPHSLYGDWIAAATGKFFALSPAPIKTLAQHDIATAMQQRAAYDACGVTASIVESSTGRTLQLHAQNACIVPVTGVSASTAGSVETYLGTPTTSVTMAAGATKSIALP